MGGPEAAEPNTLSRPVPALPGARWRRAAGRFLQEGDTSPGSKPRLSGPRRRRAPGAGRTSTWGRARAEGGERRHRRATDRAVTLRPCGDPRETKRQGPAYSRVWGPCRGGLRGQGVWASRMQCGGLPAPTSGPAVSAVRCRAARGLRGSARHEGFPLACSLICTAGVSTEVSIRAPAPCPCPAPGDPVPPAASCTPAHPVPMHSLRQVAPGTGRARDPPGVLSNRNGA